MHRYHFARSNSTNDHRKGKGSYDGLHRSQSISSSSTSSNVSINSFNIAHRTDCMNDGMKVEIQNPKISQNKASFLLPVRKKLSKKDSCIQFQSETYEQLKRELEFLVHEKHLESWLERHGLKNVDTSALRKQLETFLTSDCNGDVIMKKGVPRWIELSKNLLELSKEDNLEKWLDTLECKSKSNVDIPQVKAKLKQFVKKQSLNQCQVESIVYQEGHIAKTLWERFHEMSPVKQVLVVVSITAVIAAVGFLSLQLFALALPSFALTVGVAQTYLAEVGVQTLVQKQEPAFNLLVNHCEKLKPLTSAWTNQYTLWKYL